MLFKLVVLACVASTLAQHEYGRWVSTSPHRNDPIPPGISPPARYPAGVDPASCPNFPHCGNPNTVIGANGAPGGWNGNNANNGQWNGGANQWNGGANQWNNGRHQGGWNGGNNAVNNPAISGAYTGDGDYHGEGLQEAGAYGDISHNTEIWNNGIQGAPQNNWNQGGQWNGGQNNGQWNQQAAHNPAWQQDPNWAAHQHQQPASLPAGVNSGQCPNYPFCGH